MVSSFPKNGSTWFSLKDLKMSEEQIEKSVSDKKIYTYRNLYSPWYYAQQENRIAQKIIQLLFSPHTIISEDILNKIIDQGEKKFNCTLHSQQRQAVIMGVNSMVSVLTGGPGTGKTMVLKIIAFVLREVNSSRKIAFCAPTGKASRRIMESTGENAMTIHKKIKLSLCKNNPDLLFEDVLFVDESSMLDMDLTDKLLSALPVGKKVIFIGDTDQLPSIGAGAILRDFIASGSIPVTSLTHTFRQANESGLMQTILNIRNGISELSTMDDFIPICLDSANENACYKAIADAYLSDIKKYGRDNVVVIVPYRKVGICSNKINIMLQTLTNKQTTGYRYTSHDNGTIVFKKDDFCMQLDNRDECANGDVGVITAVDHSGVTAEFVDGKVHYSQAELEQLALAYSMSVHKSQGSEYPAVEMILLNEHGSMLERNIPYTGITRAKEKCTLLYQTKAFNEAVRTVKSDMRITMLADKLEYLISRHTLLSA